MERIIKEALAFDDVLIEPGYSEVLPKDTITHSRFSKNIALNSNKEGTSFLSTNHPFAILVKI